MEEILLKEMISLKKIRSIHTQATTIQTYQISSIYGKPGLLIIKGILLIPNGTIMKHRASPYSALTRTKHCCFSRSKASSAV